MSAATRPGLARVEHVMGMPVVVDVRDDDVDEAAVDVAFAWLRHVDETFSTYRATSEISRIARGGLLPDRASPEVREVLDACESYRLETRGYFDARPAGRLDPSGYVKGWAVDRAAAVLLAAGARNVAVNAGGDMRLAGRALPGDGWRVGIQHPLESGALAAVVELGDGAVATSGAYRRGEHILDPHTGRPPRGLLSVTVTGPELARADVYATAAFAMGAERGPRWTTRLRGYEALSILEDGTTYATPGFPFAPA
ncbi:MAG TPA: FAD:protein FMN transferase [Gaiellaceae bacterium]|nr:FAD:protein FMN transferase [Gaiellaceae bacterium]